jgi:hypothetical protein
VFQFSDQKDLPLALNEAVRNFDLIMRDKNCSVEDYLQRFQNHIEVVEFCGRTVGNHDGMLVEELGRICL